MERDSPCTVTRTNADRGLVVPLLPRCNRWNVCGNSPTGKKTCNSGVACQVETASQPSSQQQQ